MTTPGGTLETNLASFYDQQAAGRATFRVDPERETRRHNFVELLRSEDRAAVFEIGTGPGRDAIPFRDDGLAVSGIDLSAESVRYCVERGIDCRQASMFAIPFEDGAFEAGWTMSTLLHVPNDRIDAALIEITRVLAPGAPLAIGVWAGNDTEEINEDDRFEPKRFFSSGATSAGGPSSNHMARSSTSKHGPRCETTAATSTAYCAPQAAKAATQRGSPGG